MYILTVNANAVNTTNINLDKRGCYCCDKVWEGNNGGFICTGKWVNNKCECKWQKERCCDYDWNCGWFENIKEIFFSYSRKDCSS